MSWSKFAKAAAPSTAYDTIGLQGSGEIFTIGTKGLRRNFYPPLELEGGSGAAKKPPDAMDLFAKHQAAAVHVYKVNPDFWLPAWVREHIGQGGSVEGLIKEVMSRVEKDPHHASLTEAQFILNELGRSAENTAAIRKHVTRAFVKKITSSRQPNRQ